MRRRRCSAAYLVFLRTGRRRRLRPSRRVGPAFGRAPATVPAEGPDRPQNERSEYHAAAQPTSAAARSRRARHLPSAAAPRAGRSGRRRASPVDSAPQATPKRRHWSGGTRSLVARGDVAREERVTRAALGDRLALLDARAFQAEEWPSTSTCAKQPSGSVMITSRGPSAAISRTAKQALVLAGELVPDELLGLEHVRRDDVGLGADRLAQRLAVGVDHGRDARGVPGLADQAPRRSRAPRPRGSEPAKTTIAAPRAR